MLHVFHEIWHVCHRKSPFVEPKIGILGEFTNDPTPLEGPSDGHLAGRSSDLVHSIGKEWKHLSSVQNLCWLMIIGDSITQSIRDYSYPIEESLETNQDSME